MPASPDDDPRGSGRRLLDDLFTIPTPKYVIERVRPGDEREAKPGTVKRSGGWSAPRGTGGGGAPGAYGDGIFGGAAGGSRPGDRPSDRTRAQAAGLDAQGRPVIRDGAMLVQRAVLATRIDGVIHVVIAGRALPVLPCEGLAELDTALNLFPEAYFLVTAQATSYRGTNFVLLRRTERLPTNVIARTIAEETAEILSDLEQRLGIEAVDKPLGGAAVPGGERVTARRLARSRYEREQSSRVQADVDGHLSVPERNPDDFFRNDPTLSRSVAQDANVTYRPEAKTAAPPRVPPPAEVTGVGLAPGVGRGDLKDEGGLVLGRSGMLMRRPGGLVFYSDSGEAPMPVLPNVALEKADSLTTYGSERFKLRISGELTRYGGRNFLLLSRVVREPYDVNELK